MTSGELGWLGQASVGLPRLSRLSLCCDSGWFQLRAPVSVKEPLTAMGGFAFRGSPASGRTETAALLVSPKWRLETWVALVRRL